MPVMDNAHALVIGIPEYHHINTLPRVQDAQHIADLLIDPNYCGFPTGPRQTPPGWASHPDRPAAGITDRQPKELNSSCAGLLDFLWPSAPKVKLFAAVSR